MFPETGFRNPAKVNSKSESAGLPCPHRRRAPHCVADASPTRKLRPASVLRDAGTGRNWQAGREHLRFAFERMHKNERAKFGSNFVAIWNSTFINAPVTIDGAILVWVICPPCVEG